MEKVRTLLAEAWGRLHRVGETYNLKQGLNSGGLASFIEELGLVEGLIHRARKEAGQLREDVVYAIAKEAGAEEYTAFTHGPHPQMSTMLACQPEDGQILVRIEMSEGQPKIAALKGYLDGEWIDC